jgi:hypothetical protein
MFQSSWDMICLQPLTLHKELIYGAGLADNYSEYVSLVPYLYFSCSFFDDTVISPNYMYRVSSGTLIREMGSRHSVILVSSRHLPQ